MKSTPRSSSTSPRRRYDASGRQATALERQRHILRTATDLFLDQGYGGTSIDQIAKAAGVSSQSIYATFESKAGILGRALWLARTGDEEGSTSQSEAARPAMTAPDLRTRCGLVAALLREQYERSSGLIAIVVGAARTDPAIAALEERTRQALRDAVTRFNADLADDAFRSGLDRRDVETSMVLLASGSTYVELVDVGGWSPQHYEEWLGDALYRLCFAPD